MTNSSQTNWQTKRLKDVADYINGRGFKKSEWADSGKPIIRIQNLTGSSSGFNYFNGEAEDRHQVFEGDLLVSWSATIGSYIYKGEDAVLNQHIFKVEPKINKLFLHYYLKYISALMYSKSHGTGMKHITKSVFENIEIPAPPEEDQQKIVDKIEELFSVVDNLILNLRESQKRISLLKQSIYNQTLIPNVPMIPLKQLASEIKYGYTAKSSPEIEGTPILRITDIQDDTVDWSSVPNCIITDEDKNKYLLKDGDIVFARSGNTVGKTYKITANDLSSVYASYLIRIRLGSDLLSDYLYSYFQSADYWGKINKGSSGVGQPNFNGTKLGNMLIPLPDIKTQERISNQMKYQISLIKSQESSIKKEVTKFNTFKQSILKQAFEGKLV